jgi:hypothetical protein
MNFEIALELIAEKRESLGVYVRIATDAGSVTPREVFVDQLDKIGLRHSSPSFFSNDMF